MLLDWLIIGLGNPGEQYKGSLHNAGFDVLDLLIANYPKTWCSSAKMWRVELYKLSMDISVNALLVKPRTYMNLSGQIFSELRKRHYQFTPEQCVVLLDNLDLEPGNLRLKFGRSSSSHNGLRSLQQENLQSGFWRFFIGIGHPGSPEQVNRYVLQKPRKADIQNYQNSLERAKEALLAILGGAQPQELVADINRRLPV